MPPFKRRRTRRAIARQTRRLFGEQLEDRCLLSVAPHLLTNAPPSVNFPPVDVNGTAFFMGYDSVNPPKLWKSDGTAVGSVSVADVYPLLGRRFTGTSVYPASYINGTLFFIGQSHDEYLNNEYNWELWKSDGTEAG